MPLPKRFATLVVALATLCLTPAARADNGATTRFPCGVNFAQYTTPNPSGTYDFLAGVGGMSELTTITHISDHRIAYPVFVLVMSCIGVAVYWIIKRVEKY